MASPGPRLGLHATQRQTLRLGLSSGVLTALGVLRMSATELAAALAREAETNPFLLPGLPPPPAAPPGMIAGAGGRDEGATDLDTLHAAAPDWQESLLRQIALQPVAEPLARLAAYLVGELDERGWLDTPLPDLAHRDGLDLPALEAALGLLQGCEPAGIGARDLTECLTLQLVDMGLDHPGAVATLDQLPRFARRDWPGLQRALGLDPDQLRHRAALLRRLTPRPVQGETGPAPLLRPDLVLIRSATGGIGVELARDHLPRPGLDTALVRRARAEGFGADLLERARIMIQAVERRGSTLLRVGHWLAQRQEAALRDGPGALRAALRAECAADLDLHPATVGRAVAGKALVADGRLWPLRRLFTTPAPNTTDGWQAGAGPGAAAIAHRIAVLIAAEDQARPLSDSALRARLGCEGVDMARRTVAKYRNGLRIPAAHLRRRG